jgi:sigma-70-like protein
MGARWFGALRGPNHAPRSSEGGGFSDEPKAVLLHDSISAWRAWLTTGARWVPIDARRARGADAQLKKVLMGAPSGATDFSGAMARQAIDVAMNELPTQHRQVVKLAYFGGLTNRQIAQQLGLSVGAVRSRLSESLATVTAYIEKGRAVGRRAVHGLVMWMSWRRLPDNAQHVHGPAADQVMQAGIVAAMTVAAAALLVTHQAPHVTVAPLHKTPRVAASTPAPSHLPRVQTTAPATTATSPVSQANAADAAAQAVTLQSVPVKVSVPALPISLPVSLPIPVPTPPLPLPHVLVSGVLP